MLRFPRTLLATVALTTAAAAQEPSAPPQSPASDQPDPWKERQSGVISQYGEFEAVLARMADILKADEPDRAALLAKAFAKSRKELIALQLQELLQQIEDGNYADAIKEQEAVLANMNAIMELLLSEDRADKLREEQERLEQHLKKVQELTQRQKALRAQTELQQDPNAQETQRLAQAQQQLEQDTKNLAETNTPSEPGDSEQPQESGAEHSTPKEPSPDDATETPTDSKSEDGSPKGTPNDDKQQGDSSQSNPDNNKSPGADPQADPPPPGQQNLKAAQQAMQRAKEQLQNLRRQEASREQDQAIRELEKSIEQIEELLRQLREEERLELLANLESRLRKILDMQQFVYEGTLRIDQIPQEKRSRADEQKAIHLSRRQGNILVELNQVHSLLVEDGTAIAFPETIEQLQIDSQMIVDLLAKFRTDQLTQSIEADVIDTLTEMIESLQKEMQEAKKKQKQQPSQGGGQPKTPLVEKIAELKMVRSLQTRVNQRTGRIDKMIGADKPVDPAIDAAIQDLAERQSRIYQITRDIAEGKNE